MYEVFGIQVLIALYFLCIINLDFITTSCVFFLRIFILFKRMYGLFGQKYRVATLSTFYLTVSRITIPSFKSIGQFYHAFFMN